MESKFLGAVLTGIIATAAMTVFGLMAPLIGLPRMNPAEMLSGMLGVSLAIGYILHFMIGIIFAFTYVYWFNGLVKKISSRFWKGVLFGSAVFIFAQIMLWLMGMILPMPEMKEDPMLMMAASLIGHLVYGFFVAWIVPLKAPATTTDATKVAGQH